MLNKPFEKSISAKYYTHTKYMYDMSTVCLQCVYSISVDCDWLYLLSSHEQGSLLGLVCDWYMDALLQGLPCLTFPVNHPVISSKQATPSTWGVKKNYCTLVLKV